MHQIDTREGAFRRHRVIGLFAVIQCWVKGIDGVVFQRYQLERLLGMQRFRKQRREWLKADLKEYFEYREHLVLPKRSDSLASLFVSRFSLKPFPGGTMSDEERIEKIASQNGPKLAIFEMWPKPPLDKFNASLEGSVPFLSDYWNYDERVLSSYTALLAQGQVSPKSMLPKKPKQKGCATKL